MQEAKRKTKTTTINPGVRWHKTDIFLHEQDSISLFFSILLPTLYPLTSHQDTTPCLNQVGKMGLVDGGWCAVSAGLLLALLWDCLSQAEVAKPEA